MADIAVAPQRAKPEIREATTWDQLKHNRNWLGFWFMLPALAFLVLFLAYPLGLGIWLSFTDTRIGRIGQFIVFETFSVANRECRPFTATFIHQSQKQTRIQAAAQQ